MCSPGCPAAASSSGLRFLANGKFLALLTLLFGVGLELQYRSARRRGARWPGWYLWRAALLLVEGLLHYVLVFEFDVLMSYAVTSVLVTYLIGRSDRAVRAWMIAAGALHVALVGLLTVALMAAPAEQAPVASDLFASGSYPDQVAARLDQSLPYRVETIFIVPLGVVLVPARLAAAAAGAFEDGARGARLRARLMVVGLGVGVPLNVLSTFAGADWFLVDRYLMPPLVALGLLALVTTLVHCGIAGPVRGGLTAVGRTALSCYVLQNVVASVLCYGWGLGLATRSADARPWWVVGAWAGISVLNVALRRGGFAASTAARRSWSGTARTGRRSASWLRVPTRREGCLTGRLLIVVGWPYREFTTRHGYHLHATWAGNGPGFIRVMGADVQPRSVRKI